MASPQALASNSVQSQCSFSAISSSNCGTYSFGAGGVNPQQIQMQLQQLQMHYQMLQAQYQQQAAMVAGNPQQAMMLQQQFMQQQQMLAVQMQQLQVHYMAFGALGRCVLVSGQHID